MSICSVRGCYKDVVKRGMCNMHYVRWYRTGSTSKRRKTGRDKCYINDCGSDSTAFGLCNKHYSRFRKTGDPEKTITTPTGEPRRFYEDVVLQYEGDDCLEWPYGLVGNGYPGLWNGKKSDGVHTIVCEHFHGMRPEGYQTAHSCGNKKCCNHKHLRWATPKENNADKVLHGTSQIGETNGNSKLTESKVRKIKKLEGAISQRKIARMFDVSQRTIWMIFNSKSWTHIKLI